MYGPALKTSDFNMSYLTSVFSLLFFNVDFVSEQRREEWSDMDGVIRQGDKVWVLELDLLHCL